MRVSLTRGEQRLVPLTRGELISAAGALVLLVTMFALAWYGVDGIPGRSGSRTGIVGSENGWQGLTGVRWLILLTVLVAFGALAMRAYRPPRQTVAALRLALLVLGCATAVALIVRVLIDLPSPDRVVDQKLGALLGMIAGLGIAYGALGTVREQRAQLAAGTGAAPETAAE
jgi:hypothetical protein